MIKEAARLHRKRNRYESRLFLAEGEDLLDAALKRGVAPRQVFVLEGHEDQVLGTREASALDEPLTQAAGRLEIFICGRDVMAKLSALGSGSRVISVFEMLDLKFPAGSASVPAAAGAPDLAAKAAGPLLYLSAVGDPGNVGTLLRSGAALGAAAVALGPQTADPYSPKSLRATMGAIFQIPIYLTVNPEAVAAWADASGAGVVCADAHAGEPVWKAPLEGAFVLVLGSEREGIPHRLQQAATATVSIPQTGDTESINVAMAGTAILYEAMRQRSPGRQ
ncbi:MAG: TrmH family RNA methyltransferase [Thermoleophilia bacterium]